MFTNGAIRRPRQLAGPLLLALGALSTSGCGVAEDDLETAEQALAREATIDVGGATRTIKFACLNSCAEWEEDWDRKKPGYPPPKRCVRFRDDCYQHQGASLLANATDDHPFRAVGDPNRLGCGPKAAQNVLAYLNVNKTLPEITPNPIDTLRFDETPIVKWFTDNIATYPDELAEGLQSLLDAQHGGRYRVSRRTLDNYQEVNGAIYASLLKGMPIIVLARQGGHYVVVTGLDTNSRVHIIDYEGNDKWISIYQLELEIPDYVPSGVRGWRSNTVITIDPLW